jgi:hypothetical protein
MQNMTFFNEISEGVKAKIWELGLGSDVKAFENLFVSDSGYDEGEDGFSGYDDKPDIMDTDYDD